MKQIRIGVFETNSSSVHAICIATNPEKLDTPKMMATDFGEFGWEWDRIDTPNEKLSYALTALFDAHYNDYNFVVDKVKQLKDWLNEDGIKYSAWSTMSVSEAVFGKGLYWDEDYWHHDGYLDHGGEAKEFVDYVFASKDNMWNFLFSDESFVLTGNDNSESDGHYNAINADYPHEEFWKGN